MDLQAPPRLSRFVREVYGRVLRLLKKIASRIDVSNFPGSCCG
jgi:hypothetical protein